MKTVVTMAVRNKHALYTLPVPNCYCQRRENVLCGQRSDSFQPRGLLLHTGPSILPTIVLNRTVLEVAYIQSLAYKRSHVTAPAVLSNRYVPLSLSLSLSLSLFFEVAIKNKKIKKWGRGEQVCCVECVQIEFVW